MQVTIKLFAHFRDSRFKVENREIPAETTVGEIVDSLGIEKFLLQAAPFSCY